MKDTTIKDVKIIDIPKIEDVRGNISVIEKDIIPFKIERVYYLYDVPSSSYRGAHAHKQQSGLLIALSGSFEVVLNDSRSKKVFMLNKPNQGLLIPSGLWRELKNFSSGSVCLVIASGVFDEDEYIRDFNEFKKFKTQ